MTCRMHDCLSVCKELGTRERLEKSILDTVKYISDFITLCGKCVLTFFNMSYTVCPTFAQPLVSLLPFSLLTMRQVMLMCICKDKRGLTNAIEVLQSIFDWRLFVVMLYQHDSEDYYGHVGTKLGEKNINVVNICHFHNF